MAYFVVIWLRDNWQDEEQQKTTNTTIYDGIFFIIGFNVKWNVTIIEGNTYLYICIYFYINIDNRYYVN